MASLDEFLRATASIKSSIADVQPEEQPPTPIAGMPLAADPMRPWRSIEVGSYIPIPRWLIKKGFDVAALKTGEPLWAMDDEELDSLHDVLTEATQKCLYDLRLARLAGNPYIALVSALLALATVKQVAIKINREMEKREQEKRSSPSNSGVQSQENDMQQQRQGNRPTPFRSTNHPARQRVSQPSHNPMPADSSTESIRMQESGAGSSSWASRTAVNHGSFVSESEPLDE
jgi:hypothetical protein